MILEAAVRMPAITQRERSRTTAVVLEQVPRPITYLDTNKKITAVITEGDITIKGPASVIHEDVQIRERSDGSWEAVIRFGKKPEINYR
jgi:hypothetical protein